MVDEKFLSFIYFYIEKKFKWKTISESTSVPFKRGETNNRFPKGSVVFTPAGKLHVLILPPGTLAALN